MTSGTALLAFSNNCASWAFGPFSPAVWRCKFSNRWTVCASAGTTVSSPATARWLPSWEGVTFMVRSGGEILGPTLNGKDTYIRVTFCICRSQIVCPHINLPRAQQKTLTKKTNFNWFQICVSSSSYFVSLANTDRCALASPDRSCIFHPTGRITAPFSSFRWPPGLPR